MPLTSSSAAVLAEFVGTFLFVLTVPLATVGVGALAPLPIGLMLMSMVFTFGGFSGGHFNPSVSFAALMINELKLKPFLMYVAAQFAAAICAALYATTIIGLDLPTPTTSGLLDVWQTLLAEAAFTFALSSVMLHAQYSRQRSHDFAGLAAGMIVVAGGFSVFGGFKNGAFNPAVAVGIQIVSCITGDCKPLIHVWLYLLAPTAGAFLASFLYNILDTEARVVREPSKRMENIY